ncbi:MAG: hypothetical protein BGO49_03385 [Planctomycetales bacterium 71-10]|nr:MAG: hypothetical protein BGO49_03385 [Planctomycetales bacterium 71-10]
MKLRDGWTAVVAMLLAAALATGRARGGVLFENAPDLGDTFATTSDAAQPQWSADDFAVAGSGPFAITSVTWWGRFSGLTAPEADTSNFLVELYAGASGPDVSPWYRAELGAVTRTLAAVVEGVSIFEFTATLAAPAVVQAGSTYYFSVFNDDAIDDPRFAILWSSTSAAVNPRWFRQNSTRDWTRSGSNVNTAFRIEGQAVPEPSTVVMLGTAAALGATAAVRGRRRPS